MAKRSTAALVLLISLITRTVAQRSCFFPDGVTSPPDVPCDANADESACCGPDAFCMSNGLCFNSGVISRGSCTDRTWNSSACPQQCTNENLDAGLTLLNCNARLGTWICATNGNSCDNDADLFPIDVNDMNQITLRPADSDSSALLLSPNSTLGGNSSSSDGDSDGGSTATVTVTAAPETSDSTTSEAQYTAGQMAGVGAGVGVPLLLALLGAVFVLTRQRRRLQAAEAYGKENELRATQHHGHGGGYGGQQQAMPYGHFAPEQEPKVQSSAAYYRPISPSPPRGHFREVEPVMEMDGEVGRQELGSGK